MDYPWIIPGLSIDNPSMDYPWTIVHDFVDRSSFFRGVVGEGVQQMWDVS